MTRRAARAGQHRARSQRARFRRRRHRQPVSRARRRRRKRRGARIFRRRSSLLRHRAVLWLRAQRSCGSAQALRGAQTPPVISTKVGRRLVPTGPQDASIGPRGLLLATPVRAGVRLRLRVGHALACREPRASRGCAHRHPALPRHRPHDAWRCACRARRGVSRGRLPRDARTARCRHGARHRARRERMGDLRRAARMPASSTASCSPAATRCSNSRRWKRLLAAVRATPRVHHLRRSVQLRHSRGRLARRRADPLQLRRAAARGTRTRDPARSSCARSSPCRCRPRRCSSRWGIRRSPA